MVQGKTLVEKLSFETGYDLNQKVRWVIFDLCLHLSKEELKEIRFILNIKENRMNVVIFAERKALEKNHGDSSQILLGSQSGL